MRQMCKALLPGICSCVHVCLCVGCLYVSNGNIKCFPLLLSPLCLGDRVSHQTSTPLRQFG